MTPIIKDYRVFNPDFHKDVIRFMGLTSTEDEVERQVKDIDDANPLTRAQLASGELSLKARLNALMDRIEFIHHLELVSRYAIESKFVILGEEVRGIHWDIDAQRLYLALTCIDIFCERTNHRDQFERAFADVTGQDATILSTHIALKKADGTTGSLKDIGLFFYNVRNFYTHSGRRYHIVANSFIAQEQSFTSGSKRSKETQTLIVSGNVNVIDMITRIAVNIAKRRFGWATS